jgi:hypothetical protein
VNIYTKEIVVMAVIKKTLFAENLDRYQTFVTDTNPTSEYFKITELSDTFTGGKNAFLIQGSDYLVPDTLIKIEIKDSKGNIIYHEPGEGIVSSSVDGAEIVTEYYEGVSKVVAVHIYPDTSYGPATITILGELSSYNSSGLNSPIPLEWEGKYNVKWQKQINVNPSLANTTKIRFYRRPAATIVETLSPIYTIVSGSKVESNIVSSFANVTLSNLDTFAGDVKRIKVYRTSEGDISDYDMIQDILLESKELLTSYELTGSVIGEAGLMTSEVLQKLWSYPTLTTQLTSSRIDNGVKLNGSGYFRYTSSLQLSANSVYEFGIDAFYSASTNSDMGIYISGSNNGEILVGTLNGISPTKNLNDSVIEFRLPSDEPTASLYLSQSQSEWHIGNLSLKLTQDTAFSPSEIAFVTSMPTVVGNETYNFKFEFYDVNNNYVPVLVTKSALFTGGNNNIGGTLIFISASASSSLSQLYAVSSSISGTATLYSSSASTTIVTLSGSVSGSITSLSSSVSGSITSLSGSVSGSITSLSSSVSGSITSLSSSVSASITSLSSSVSSSNAVILSSSFAQVKNLANGQFSGSFIGDDVIYSPTIGGQQGYISEKFQVGDTTPIILDARTSTRKIYIGGVNDTGSYNSGSTPVYMDSTGKFSLKDKLTWDGNSTLTVTGQINIVAGGNAATQTFANTVGTNAVTSGSNAAANAVASGSASAQAAQTAAELFATSAAGRAVTSGSAAASAAQQAAITQAKADASASVNLLANGNWTAGSGTFITSNSISSPVIAGNAGYISTLFKVGQNGITLDGTNKKIYVGGDGTNGYYNNANTPFYFASGSTDIFSLGNKLSFNGSALTVNGIISASAGNFSGNITSTATIAGGTISGSTVVGGNIIGGTITGGSITIGGSNFSVSTEGELRARNAILSGSINATSGQIGNWVIDGNILRDSNSTIKLNPTARAIDILKDGAVKTTLNGNTVLSGIGSLNVYLPEIPSVSGQINTSFSITSDTTYTTATYYTDYSPNFAIDQAGPVKFSFYRGNIAVGGSFPDGQAYCNGASGGGIREISVTGDTLITLADGSTIMAKDITKNTQILSWDWRNNFNKFISNPVTEISSRTVDVIYKVKAGEYEVKVSDSHEFWLDNNDKISVGDLIVGQTEIYIKTENSIKKVLVESVETINHNVDVYTLSVAGTNNYISDGIISHNIEPPIGGTTSYNGQAGFGSAVIYAELYNNTNGQTAEAQIGYAGKSGGAYYCNESGYSILSPGYSNPQAASALNDTNITIPSVGSYKWRYKIVIAVSPSRSADYYGQYTANSTTFNITVGNSSGYSTAGTLLFPTNIVEVTNAGIQILNDQTSYLRMPRFDGASSWNFQPLLEILGGTGIRVSSFSYASGGGTAYTTALDVVGAVQVSSYSSGSGYSQISPLYNGSSNLGEPGRRWGQLFATTATISTSDRNEKTEISGSDLGLNLIKKLKPVKYKFINNTSDRFHYGLISQDVSSSLGELGVPTKDFAGYIETHHYTSGSYQIPNVDDLDKLDIEEKNIDNWQHIKGYGLRYEEFISPMIKAIQQLSEKVEELEARISGSI